jgi:hypothetical integral membrane protein (TIGR02206 family)
LTGFLAFDTLCQNQEGISLWGSVHMAWLGTGLWVYLCLARIYRNAPPHLQRRLRLGMAGTLGALELTRTLVLAMNGAYDVYSLPLHLCGLSLFVVIYHAIRQTPFSGQFLYALGMPGALLALVFPDWIDYPPLCTLSILSFSIHILLVLYPAVLLASGDLRPEPTLLPKCFLSLLALAGVVYLFDRRFDANYMFLLRPAPHSPLSWFAGWLGIPGYVLGFLPMLALVWLILYGLPWLYVRCRRRDKRSLR